MDNVSSAVLLCMAGLRGTALSRLPSSGIARLHRYYPAIRLPGCHLPSFVSCQAYHKFTHPRGPHRFSPVGATSLCNMADLRPRGAVLRSHQSDIHILPSARLTASAHHCFFLSGLNRLMTLSPTFPCFAYVVTDACYRFVTGGWLGLTGRDFHPLNVAPFLGALSVKATCVLSARQ